MEYSQRNAPVSEADATISDGDTKKVKLYLVAIPDYQDALLNSVQHMTSIVRANVIFLQSQIGIRAIPQLLYVKCKVKLWK